MYVVRVYLLYNKVVEIFFKNWILLVIFGILSVISC